MAITVVGSVALDSIASAAGSVERAVGGSAIHFANAASLSTTVRVVGVVGEDFPFERVEFLRARGVDLSGVEVVKGGKTFFWKGHYPGDMNKAVSEITELNVFETFSPELAGERRASEFLFLANIHPRLQEHVRAQAAPGAFVVLDSMNFWIDSARADLEAVLSRVDAVVLNDEEIRAFTGKATILAAARDVLARGPEVVVVKKGEHGVLCLSAGWTVALPAFPVEQVVDPTGAGDSFAGATVGYLDKARAADPAGWNSRETWKRALAWATCVASFNVEDFSVAGIARLDRAAVLARFAKWREACFVESVE